MQVALRENFGFDPRILDSYFLRVFQASEDLQLTLVADIADDDNRVLVPAHTQLSEFLVRRLQNRSVASNLSDVFYSERLLNWQGLLTDFNQRVVEDEFLNRLNEHLNLADLLRPLLAQFDASLTESAPLEHRDDDSTHSALMIQPQQKDFLFRLSILKSTCFETYHRTLLCTWLCLLIAKEMRLDERETRVLFIASLSHDLGMLHVPTEILSSEETLSPEDWFEIQKHVLASAYIGRESFAEKDSVFTAIMEHHERCDGTGYPEGKVESELSLSGKILGLSDSVIAIFRNRFDSKIHSWREAIPVVQMNAQAYFFRHGEILANLWRKVEMPSRRMISKEELDAFVLRLRRDYLIAQDWFATLTQGFISIGFTHGDRKLHSMQNVALHLVTSSRGTGLFSEEFTLWLNALNDDSFEQDSKKIQEAHINLQEVILHLQKLTRMLKLFLDEDHCEHEKIQNKLNDVMGKIKLLLKG